MARDHARFQVAIWNDKDWKSLDRDDQRMYLTLASQKALSYCGVLDYMPSRLATYAADETEQTVENAVWRLEERNYVLLDADTRELLVRTFVRHDGLLKVPNVTKAMVKDRAAVLSDLLRDAIDAELQRAYRDDPSLPGWEKGLKEADPDLYRKVTGKGSRKGSPKGAGNGAANGALNGVPNPALNGAET